MREPGPLEGVSHRGLVQEAMVEVEEGLLGLLGAQRSQHVRVQAAELGTQSAACPLPRQPNPTLPCKASAKCSLVSTTPTPRPWPLLGSLGAPVSICYGSVSCDLLLRCESGAWTRCRSKPLTHVNLVNHGHCHYPVLQMRKLSSRSLSQVTQLVSGEAGI